MAKNNLKDLYTSGRSDSVGWALIFFWGALVVLLEATGYSARFSWWDGWSVFFTGFGIIALSGVPFLFKYGRREKAGWDLFFGLIMLGVGLSDLVNFGWIWVVILLIIGFAILSDAFKKKKE